MKRAIIALLILTLQSCMVSFKKSHQSVKNTPPAAQIIEFEEVDGNNDGKITKEEADLYNKIEKSANSKPDLATPAIIMSCIFTLILLICSGKKIKNLISKLFKDK